MKVPHGHSKIAYIAASGKLFMLCSVVGWPSFMHAATGPTLQWPPGTTGPVTSPINKYDPGSDPMMPNPPIKLTNLIIKNNSGRDFDDMTITTGTKYLNFNFNDGSSNVEKTIGAGNPPGSQSIDLKFEKPIKNSTTVDLIAGNYKFSSSSLDNKKSFTLTDFYNVHTDTNVLLVLTPSLKGLALRQCGSTELLQTLIASGCSSGDKNYVFDQSVSGINPSNTNVSFSYIAADNTNTISFYPTSGVWTSPGLLNYSIEVNDLSTDYLFSLTAVFQHSGPVAPNWITAATNSYGTCSYLDCQPGLLYNLYEVRSVVSNTWPSGSVTGLQNTVSQAPGPIPLAGAAMAFRLSRKLRNRTKAGGS